MRFSELDKRDRVLFAVGTLVVVLGGLMLLGQYTNLWFAALGWLRRLSRIALPLALIAVGAYVVWGVRNHEFDNLLTGDGRKGALQRPSSDSRIAGVCGGIAQYFGIESMFVRIVAVLLAFASPLLTLIVYAMLVFVMPRG